MTYFVDQQSEKLGSAMLQRALGKEICELLWRMDAGKLQADIHDQAVDLLVEIYHILKDETIADGDCVEQILAVYYREFGSLTLRHKDHLQRIIQLSKNSKEKDG